MELNEDRRNFIQRGPVIPTGQILNEKILLELIENQIAHGVKTKLEAMEERIRPKIKKRLKISEYENYLKGKVNYNEFKK